VLDTGNIIRKVKSFIKDNYPLDQELPTIFRAEKKKKKKKTSFQDDFLSKYVSRITVDDDIDRYFNLPRVSYIQILGETSIE